MSKHLEEEMLRQATERQITDNKKSAFQAAENLDICTYIIDPETHILCFVSQNTERKLSEAAVGKLCYEVIRGKTAPCEDCPMATMLRDEETEYSADFYNDLYKTWSWMNASIIRLSDHKAYGLFNCYNIVEYKNLNGEYMIDVDSFTKDSTLYDALCRSTDDYIYMCDIAKDLFYFPKTMVEEFDLPSQIIEGAVPLWSTYIHEDERELFLSAMADLMSGKTDIHCQEYRAKNKDGAWIWLRCSGYLKHDSEGNATLFAGIITNLGKKNKIDPLSGLLNKYEFENLIRTELSDREEGGVLLLMGLDNFKNINDLYGWEFGDQIIRNSAQKIQGLLPERIQLYRLDGDKYGVYFNKLDTEMIERLYKEISLLFRSQQKCEGHRYYCTISGGYSVYEGEPISFHTLFKQAEYALEYSKKVGKNRLTGYDALLMGNKDRTLTIIERLHESVDQGCKEFELNFQPQFETSSGEINSAEALLRWGCPEYGSVSPMEFIPLLEQSGLIHTVGRWVIKEAAAVCREWQAAKDKFTMNVNLSFSQIQDKELIPYLKQIIESYELEPAVLHLEITESCIVSGSLFLTPAFQALRKIGFKIEMDDFGTGYSSLEVLKNAPADVVKIDRAFVKDITKRDFDATFIQFVTSLCHSVGIKVCLEGVETWEEYRIVESMEVDLIQGYLFGRPQNKKDFEKLFLYKSST